MEIISEQQLNFHISTEGIFDNNVQMYHALLDKDHNLLNGSFESEIGFESHLLPLDIFDYYQNRGEEEYYSLLTKTVYGLNQDVSYFTEERLSDEDYLQKIMPYNKLSKAGEDYELKVGFGAPDISYSLEFYDNCKMNEKFEQLGLYFNQFDQLKQDPSLMVLQHNHTFGKVLGQKTSKMSVSVTRYFEAGPGRTLVINYTLNFIHNLPPALFGGGNILINQMKEGAAALVRDTRNVCEEVF